MNIFSNSLVLYKDSLKKIWPWQWLLAMAFALIFLFGDLIINFFVSCAALFVVLSILELMNDKSRQNKSTSGIILDTFLKKRRQVTISFLIIFVGFLVITFISFFITVLLSTFFALTEIASFSLMLVLICVFLTYISVYLIFFYLILWFDNKPVIKAFKSSFQLVRGNWWRVFGILLVGSIVPILIPAIVAALLIDYKIIAAMICIVLSALSMPFLLAIILILFYDLKLHQPLSTLYTKKGGT